jgi:hypothetical protein
MLGLGLIAVLVAWVMAVAWRALRGPAPTRPIRFAVAAAVTATIHLGFHAAATAAPTLDAVALVLAGWTTFGLWCLWLGRVPSRGFRQNDDDGPTGSDGPGGGGGGPDDGRPSDGPGPGGNDVDWDAFERDFAAYVERRAEPEPERGLEPAAD